MNNDVDFYFVPLVFLDSFTRPAANLKFTHQLTGKTHFVIMSLSSSIVVIDPDLGTMELLEISRINDRDFMAFVMNPINSFAPNWYNISIVDIFSNVTFNFPKIRHGGILAMPLSLDEENPECCFMVNDMVKLPESLDISKIF